MFRINVSNRLNVQKHWIAAYIIIRDIVNADECSHTVMRRRLTKMIVLIAVS